MPYATRAQITAKLPAPFLNDAMDDNGDGNEDAGLLDQIIATASSDVDAFLAGVYTTPFPDPAPAVVSSATLIFTLKAIYDRRPVGEKGNPWASQYNWWRGRLEKIGNRELPLDAGAEGIPVSPAAANSNPVVPGRLTGFTF